MHINPYYLFCVRLDIVSLVCLYPLYISVIIILMNDIVCCHQDSY